MGETTSFLEPDFEKRLRQNNNSYYKSNHKDQFLLPTSCNIKYDPNTGSKITDMKMSENLRSSLPINFRQERSNSGLNKPCKSKKRKEFNRILSEKVLVNKPKSRNSGKHINGLHNSTTQIDKLGWRKNKTARFKLYQSSIENKTCQELTDKRTRNESLLKNEMSNLSIQDKTHQKKLISSLKKEVSNKKSYLKSPKLGKASKKINAHADSLDRKMKKHGVPSNYQNYGKDASKSNSRNFMDGVSGLRYSR